MTVKFFKCLQNYLQKRFELRSVTFVDGAFPASVTRGQQWASHDGNIVFGSLGDRLDRILLTEVSRLSRRRPVLCREVEFSPDRKCRLLLELHKASSRLLVLGAGHVGRALCRFANDLGFRVVVQDDLQERLYPGLFPEGTDLVCGSFSDTVSLLSPGPGDFAVIVTRGHSGDYDALLSLAGCNLDYIGMIGSSRKVDTLFRRARENGVDEKFLQGIYSPIGLDLGGETPAEIALSVAAEMLAVLYGRDPCCVGSCRTKKKR